MSTDGRVTAAGWIHGIARLGKQREAPSPWIRWSLRMDQPQNSCSGVLVELGLAWLIPAPTSKPFFGDPWSIPMLGVGGITPAHSTSCRPSASRPLSCILPMQRRRRRPKLRGQVRDPDSITRSPWPQPASEVPYRGFLLRSLPGHRFHPRRCDTALLHRALPGPRGRFSRRPEGRWVEMQQLLPRCISLCAPAGGWRLFVLSRR